MDFQSPDDHDTKIKRLTNPKFLHGAPSPVPTTFNQVLSTVNIKHEEPLDIMDINEDIDVNDQKMVSSYENVDKEMEINNDGGGVGVGDDMNDNKKGIITTENIIGDYPSDDADSELFIDTTVRKSAYMTEKSTKKKIFKDGKVIFSYIKKPKLI